MTSYDKTKNIYNVLEWLEASAGRFPDKVAVTDDAGSLTYAELCRLSANIGTALAVKLPARTPVAVFAEKGNGALCAFFGAAYAGCFYSLFNPELPEARLIQMQSVLKAPLILTDSAHLELAARLFPDAEVCLISALTDTAADTALLAGIRGASADTDPLYANFTSGSTGTPKAVLVCHRSVLDFIGCFTDIFGIGETDIIANQAPFDFDVSVKDIYSAVRTGASLVIVPKYLFSKPQELQDYLCDNAVTTMIWAVSALCLISTFHGLDYRTPLSVRRVLFSGEVMPMKHLRSWTEHLPEATFVNLYGPTEITCNCTYHVIDRDSDYSAGIPIGRPFPNERVFLLDAKNRLITAPGETGEICVAGTALALGYYGAPELTAAVFTQNPLQSAYPERIYRTGDLGRLGEDGNLYFCGRKDFQIKHMGHRIELEEIESAVSRQSGVERCVCLFDGDKDKLYCFYTGTVEKRELYAALKEILPVYMLPGAYRRVDSMPLTKNGKVDRKELLASVSHGGERKSE